MPTGWTISMGPQGAALNDYRGYADIRFVDPLYDYGAAQVVITSLEGFAAPAKDWAIRLVYDKGLATEQVHWEGVITAAEKKQEGNVYVIQAYTPDGLLQVNQTGGIRNYVAKTPHQIIQAAGTPNPLLVNAQGVAVLPYGTSASVPNKVEATSDRMGSFSGTIANDQFVAHSKSLLDNVKRLCWQARYTNDATPDGSSDGDLDGSYGLEWRGRLEGANNSTPTFYLVKRRERAAAYTPELFIVPTDMHRAKRGNPTFPGADTIIVVGAGDGNTRIASAVAGAGTRELVLDDKAIYTTVNANNFAQRALQVYGVTTEAITGITSRHNSPTRAGDTVTIRQTGYADVNLRVIARFYDTTSRMFTFALGRPQPKTRELLMGQLGYSAAAGTAPQFTDAKAEALQSTTQRVRAIRASNITIAAGATQTICDTAVHGVGPGNASLTDLLKSEGLLVQALLVVDASVVRAQSGGHGIVYDKTTSVTIGTANSGNAGADPHGHSATPNHTQTAAGGAVNAPLLSGPFQLIGFVDFAAGPVGVQFYQAVLPGLKGGTTCGDIRNYQFALKDVNGAYTPSRVYLQLRNDGDLSLVLNSGTEFGVYQDALHKHNEL